MNYEDLLKIHNIYSELIDEIFKKLDIVKFFKIQDDFTVIDKMNFKVTKQYSDNHVSFLPFLKCKFCHNILNNPYTCRECGENFCKKCLKEDSKNVNICLNLDCMKELDAFQNKCLEDRLNNIQIRCPVNEECKEILEIKKIKEHLIECKYYELIFKCKFCKKQLTKMNHINKNLMLYEHIKACENFIRNCDNCHKIMKGEENLFNLSHNCIININDVDEIFEKNELSSSNNYLNKELERLTRENEYMKIEKIELIEEKNKLERKFIKKDKQYIDLTAVNEKLDTENKNKNKDIENLTMENSQLLNQLNIENEIFKKKRVPI